MQQSEIHLESLDVVEYGSHALGRYVRAKVRPPRVIYRDSSHYYKIWDKDYGEPRTIIHDGRPVTVDIREADGKEALPGFRVGLFDSVVCPAFVDYIHDGDLLVGYVTRAGEPLASFEPGDDRLDAYIDSFKSNTLRSGYVYRDLKPRNIIRLPDGRFSLIDLECPIASLSRLHLNPALRKAQLDPSRIHPGYLAYVMFLKAGKTTDPEILAARQGWSMPLEFSIVPARSGRTEAQARLRRRQEMQTLVERAPDIGN